MRIQIEIPVEVDGAMSREETQSLKTKVGATKST